MASRDPRLNELDKLISSGKGDFQFSPRITIEDDPTGPGRKLWCWHLPGGVREFHGLPKMVPLKVSLEGYVKALSDRFRLSIDPTAVECPEGERPAAPPTAIEVMRRPLPVQAPLTGAISELIPRLISLGNGEKVKVRAPDSSTPYLFKNNLRSALNQKHPESSWSLTSIFPNDQGYVPGEDKTVFTVEREDKNGRITATKRVEERVETRVTESTVSMPSPMQVVPVPPPPPPAVLDSEDERKYTPRPDSYLPADGEAAKRILDLHERMSSIEDIDEQAGEYDALMDEIWGIADEVKRYRDAKRITDSVLLPWLNTNFDLGVFEEEDYRDIWEQLWKGFHCSLMRLVAKEESKRERESKKELDRHQVELLELKALHAGHADFLELALKFFAEEDKLSEADWKRINDKELPTMARKILEARK